jgi:secreted PhoX family phosphatase
MRLNLIAAALSSAFVLTACLDGGGSGSSVSTGILSDAYVKGISYTASPSGRSGATGTNGEFEYIPGDKVTFKLGSVTLGEIDMTSSALGLDSGRLMVRPKDLAGVVDETDEKALAVAQIIQSAANAGVNDKNIDVSANAAKFTTVGKVSSLTDVDTLTPGTVVKVSLEKVTEHLLKSASNVKSVEFTPTDITNLTDAQRAMNYTTSSAKVTYADGSTKTFPLSFVNLFNNIDTNKTADSAPAAGLRDIHGTLLKDGNGATYVSQTPDANSLMDINGTPYLVTHFEYENSNYGKLPATMTLAKLKQSASDGKMTVESIKPVDFSQVNGLWIPCAGSRSPWNTHLGSEEYEPDARCEVDNTYLTTSKSCISTNGDFTARMNGMRVTYGATGASPYQYGRVPEVTINIDGSSKVEKWYTLGRISREKVQFFADSKTAIQGDDGTYTMLTMFVADKAKDLSAGSLYAAKWVQTGTVNGGTATLSWIKLGHGTHDDIKKAVDAGVKFSDLFEYSATAAQGFTPVMHGHEAKTDEFLKLKTGTFAGVDIATLAAFLETRRYGALMGATSEFEKMEGVAYNARDNKAYIAMSSVVSGMADVPGDTVNDIKLPAIKSGAVFELKLGSGVNDFNGTPINSNFVPTTMAGLVVGKDIAADADGNTSDLEGISRPDNVFFSERMRVLFIGEDSSYHVNNYLWAYHVDTAKLVRIMSLPMGAESTGLQVVENMKGFSYIMSNYQHAGDKNGTATTTYNRLLPLIDPKKAEVGYLGGLPAIR